MVNMIGTFSLVQLGTCLNLILCNGYLHVQRNSFILTIYRLNGNGMRQFLLCFGRHGVVRTDYHILFDPNLSFIDVLKTKQATSHSSSPLPTKGKNL